MTNGPKRSPQGALDNLERATCLVMVLAMVVLIVGVSFQVVARCALGVSFAGSECLVYPLSWSQELVQYAFVWMVFLGAGVGTRRRLHLRISFLDNSLGRQGRRWMGVCIDVACMVLAVVFIIAGSIVAWRTRLHVSPATGVPIGLVYCVFPLSGLGLLAFLVESMVRGGRPVEAEEPGDVV